MEMSRIPANNAMEISQIKDFYKNQKVFITGGTGYVGTLLIEKLLRSTEVDLIYVMVRKKSGKDAQTRIRELLANIIFDKVKELRSDTENRIKPICGDCSEINLGIAEEDREDIINNVNIIFHNAALVKLNGDLVPAYYTNVQGTHEMLELSLQLKNLKSMIHVSTAYSNCLNAKIDERIYDCPCTDLKDAIGGNYKFQAKDIVEKYTRDGWPDSYAFTKSIAESMIKDRVGKEPIGIFRPAVVGTTYNEPLAGWISNVYGPTGLMAGVYEGSIRVFRYGADCRADMIPGDKCVAGMIAAAWDVGTNQIKRPEANIPIYNFVSLESNPLTWGEFIDILCHEMKYCPSVKAQWAQTFHNVRQRKLAEIVLHFIPALLLDIISCLQLRRPKFLKRYQKIHDFLDAIEFYGMRSWDFETKNVTSLWSRMNRADREAFPMDMNDIDWLKYMRSYAKGLRIYVLKDPISTLEDAKLKSYRLNILHGLVKYITIISVSYIMWIVLLNIFNRFIVVSKSIE